MDRKANILRFGACNSAALPSVVVPGAQAYDLLSVFAHAAFRNRRAVVWSYGAMRACTSIHIGLERLTVWE